MLVLALVALAGFHLLGRSSAQSTSVEERERFSERYGNKLFLPALIIPFTAFIGTLLFNYTPLKNSGLIDPKSVTLVLLGRRRHRRADRLLSVVAPARDVVRRRRRTPCQCNRLGAGASADACRTGRRIRCGGRGHDHRRRVAGTIIPQGSVFLAVLLYALGMVIFTMIMGNAFAAFPVMVAAIGVPILIQQDGGRAAVIGAVGMLAGYCGTLMTPMAANFNIVPAALLELKNQYGVVKVQIATAIPLLICNIVILYVAGFRL